VQVGDAISCFVYDVEDGAPLLTQRAADEADEELAAAGGADEDSAGVNGDALLEEMDPARVAAAAAAAAAASPDAESADEVVSAVPEELRLEVYEARRTGAPRAGGLVEAALVGMRLPDRGMVRLWRPVCLLFCLPCLPHLPTQTAAYGRAPPPQSLAVEITHIDGKVEARTAHYLTSRCQCTPLLLLPAGRGCHQRRLHRAAGRFQC
jgi:hypothetical protein